MTKGANPRRVRTTFLSALQQIKVKVESDQVFVLASSLAFTTVLSLAPLLALMYYFFSVLGGLDQLQENLNQFILANLAPSFGDRMMDLLAAAKSHISSEAMGVFGIVGFAYTSASMLSKIEHFFNLIWGRKRKAKFFKRFAIYISIIVVGPLLLGLSFYVSSHVADWLKQDNGEISRAILLLWAVVPYFFTSFIFVGMYMLLPAGEVNRKSAWLSGLGAGLVFEFAKHSYAAYANYSLENSVYGSLAILPVFLVWLNLGWVIVLGGAIVCCYFDKKANTDHDSRK